MSAEPAPHPELTRTEQVFGADLRSLAAFRIAMATILLLDLGFRAQYLDAFYTDGGWLPRIARIALMEDHDPSGLRHIWSLHLLSGQAWAQWILFGIAAWFGVCLLIGYRTRRAAVISWLLILSLDGRNPFVIDSGDILYRSLLFWALFVPLGRTWSADAWLTRRNRTDTSPPPRHVTSPATFALVLQTCSMYWFSIGFKASPTWMQELDAVYYALNNDIFTTPLGHFLLQFPKLLKGLTLATLLLEAFGPILVFIPYHNARLRGVAVAAFWVLHLGFGMCLDIGLFAWICIAAWLPMLPGCAWDRIAVLVAHRPMPRWWTWFRDAGRGTLARLPSPERPRYRLSRAKSWIVVLLLCYMLAWNIRESNLSYWESLMPRQWSTLGRVLGLDQRWSMFAPIPSTEDGWYVMKGTLRNGEEVNLWEPGVPFAWQKPGDVRATFASQRWRKYLDMLKNDGSSELRRFFVNWLVERWNREQARGDDRRRVQLAELILQLEETPRPGAGQFEPLTIVLWRWEYE